MKHSDESSLEKCLLLSKFIKAEHLKKKQTTQVLGFVL